MSYDTDRKRLPVFEETSAYSAVIDRLGRRAPDPILDAILDEFGGPELDAATALFVSTTRGGTVPGEGDIAWAEAGAVRDELLEIELDPPAKEPQPQPGPVEE